MKALNKKITDRGCIARIVKQEIEGSIGLTWVDKLVGGTAYKFRVKPQRYVVLACIKRELLNVQPKARFTVSNYRSLLGYNKVIIRVSN